MNGFDSSAHQDQESRRRLCIAFGERGFEAYIYAREARVSQARLDWPHAEAFAKAIARTLTEAWNRP